MFDFVRNALTAAFDRFSSAPPFDRELSRLSAEQRALYDSAQKLVSDPSTAWECDRFSFEMRTPSSYAISIGGYSYYLDRDMPDGPHGLIFYDATIFKGEEPVLILDGGELARKLFIDVSAARNQRLSEATLPAGFRQGTH